MLFKTTITSDHLKLIPATGSRRVNNHPYISKETRRLVMETMPGDIELPGFAKDFDEHHTPTLPSIDQQAVQMRRKTFNLLLRLIKNNHSGANISKIILEPVSEKQIK